jgi:hypothetical protein
LGGRGGLLPVHDKDAKGKWHYFRTVSLTPSQQIDAFLDYYELELFEDLVPDFDCMKPWWNPFQLEVRIAN